jgi:tRNA(Ile)-lysidine synthase
MSGEKKLQDFFVDSKLPRQERARIPLLVTGGRIAWVIGRRIAEDFRFQGDGPACLVEVEFPRAWHALPVGKNPDHGV